MITAKGKVVYALKYCPYCGSSLQEKMVYCPKCGRRFVEAGDGVEQVDEVFLPSDGIDSVKGKQERPSNRDDGRVTNQSLKSEGTDKRRKEKRTHIVVILFVSVLLLVFLGLFLFFGGLGVPRPVLDSRNSVVRIVTEYFDGYGFGSGFVVSSNQYNSYVVTNAHVVEGAMSIVVLQGEKEYNAEIKKLSKNQDLCILVTSKLSGRPLALSGTDAKQGSTIYAAGFPAAADIFSDQLNSGTDSITITNGIVSAVRNTKISDYGPQVMLLQVNAALNPGNSGGPLLDRFGRVVGINTFGAEEAQGIFAAIAVSELQRIISSMNIGEVKTGGLYFPLLEDIPIRIIVLVIVAVVFILVMVIILRINRKRSSTKDDSRSRVRSKKKRKVRRRQVLLCVLISLVLAVAVAIGFYFFCYNKARKYADKDDFSEAQKYLIFRQLQLCMIPILMIILTRV